MMSLLNSISSWFWPPTPSPPGDRGVIEPDDDSGVISIGPKETDDREIFEDTVQYLSGSGDGIVYPITTTTGVRRPRPRMSSPPRPLRSRCKS